MRRIAEVVLGIIGALMYGFTLIIAGMVVWAQSNEEIIKDALVESGSGDLTGDVTALFEDMGNSGWMMVILLAVAIIAGIVAMILVRGNKKPVTAGIIFIATAVIIAIFTFGIGILGGIFYLVAGILCLARREKKILADDDYNYA